MLGTQVLDYVKDKLLLSGVPAGSIVHVGCGANVEIDFYVDMRFQEVYLFDASEEVCNQLEFSTAAHAGVHIRHAVVADTNGRRKIHRTNNQDFDSLEDPGKLTDFFPNLKVVATEDVETVALGKVLQQAAADEERFNVLIAEIGGDSCKLFQTVSAIDLQRFSILIIKRANLNVGSSVSGGGLDSCLEKNILIWNSRMKVSIHSVAGFICVMKMLSTLKRCPRKEIS
ncbi:hypothetical protein [Microbulbifer taiwanensis]|uniref:hypothetical protein n=1 Tax=Microbulbifer taiwanensis TaxID=986746 RepID=UPI003617EE81